MLTDPCWDKIKLPKAGRSHRPGVPSCVLDQQVGRRIKTAAWIDKRGSHYSGKQNLISLSNNLLLVSTALRERLKSKLLLKAGHGTCFQQIWKKLSPKQILDFL
jgi:hypothetical protein